MLIRDDGDTWTAIGQPAHAWVAGEIARAWGNDRFAPPPHREDFCLGAEQHDVGWSQWDLRPPLHPPARRAASFYEAPIRPRMEIWVGAPQRVLAQSPIAALLVSLHGTNIHTRYVDARSLEADDAGFVNEYLEAAARASGPAVRGDGHRARGGGRAWASCCSASTRSR